MRTLVIISAVLSFLGVAAPQELRSRPRPVTPVPQTSRALANNDPVYVALRNVKLSSEVIPVHGFRMYRDAGIFTFRSGAFYLLEPVNGRTTGAVFLGDAVFSLTPPTEVERRYLKILAKDEFVEQFGAAVFRFTDGTEEELRKAMDKAAELPSGDPGGLLKETQDQLRKRLKEHLDGRLLQDLLSSQKGGKFVAFILGSRFSGNLIYDIDPYGVVSYIPDPGPIFVADPRVQ